MKTMLFALICLNGFAARCGEISEIYFKTHPGTRGKPSEPTKSNVFSVPTNYVITEIGIEHSPCFGQCPVYSFIIKSDGTCRYKGVQYVEHIGDFSGKISRDEFARLAKLVSENNYFSFNDSYSTNFTDHATVFTSVVANEKRKIVSDYAQTGPPKLNQFEKQIDKLMESVIWDKLKTP